MARRQTRCAGCDTCSPGLSGVESAVGMAEIPTPIWTAYSPQPGTDPVWDALLASFIAREARAKADVERQRSTLDTEYQAGVASLDAAAPGQRQDLESTLLSRGVGRSGEALRRRADLEAQMLGQRTDAERAYASGQDALESSYQTAISDLALEREKAIADSRLRLLGQDKKVDDVTVPGAGGAPGTVSSGYKTGSPSKKSSSKSLSSKKSSNKKSGAAVVSSYAPYVYTPSNAAAELQAATAKAKRKAPVVPARGYY